MVFICGASTLILLLIGGPQVVLSLAPEVKTVNEPLGEDTGFWLDILNGAEFTAEAGGALRREIPSCWGRVLVRN